MEIFIVSFLVFTGVCLILLLCQRLSKAQLPVGCTPATGTCCLVSETPQLGSPVPEQTSEIAQ